MDAGLLNWPDMSDCDYSTDLIMLCKNEVLENIIYWMKFN